MFGGGGGVVGGGEGTRSELEGERREGGLDAKYTSDQF